MKRVLFPATSQITLLQIAVTGLKAEEVTAAQGHPDIQEVFYMLQGDYKILSRSTGDDVTILNTSFSLNPATITNHYIITYSKLYKGAWLEPKFVGHIIPNFLYIQ